MRTLRVATLNIWNRFGPWDERLVAIHDGVRALDPDLLGLQEVLRLDPLEGDGLDQAAVVGAPFGYHSAYARARDQRWYGNAALSRWPVLRSTTLELPRCGTDEKRSLLFAEIEAPFARVPFFVTHLNWKFEDGHVREAQVREIAAFVESVATPDAFPAVLVGDFNAAPDSDEIRFLRGLTSLGGSRRVFFQDAFEVAGDGSPGVTYARRNPFAAPLREPDRRIDYVFVRGRDERFRGEPLEAKVCFDSAGAGAAPHGVFPSDHFGVVATLRVE